MYRVKILLLVLVPVAWFAAAAPIAAQDRSGRESADRNLTREELSRLLERYERVARSDTVAAAERTGARELAERIRTRLENGDFHVGDRIALVVANEPALTDTFTVRSGRQLTLPSVGDVSLGGVLRSELTAHLRDALSRYVRSPTVRAESLIRLGVLGNVGAPGFYTIRADAPVTDVFMVAGGPGTDADLSDVRIERADEEVWKGERLQQALSEGRTLDELDLRAGDRIVVPAAGEGFGFRQVLDLTRWALSIAFLANRVF